jgi:hypothetical protein
VPRYFFHIVDDDGRSPDEEGLELADLDAASQECERSARQLLVQTARNHQVIDHRRIEVSNVSGAVLKVCRLKDLIN